MSTESGEKSGDKLGIFLLGMLAGMAALTYLSEKPKPSRRYEDYLREREPSGPASAMTDDAFGFDRTEVGPGRYKR
jgi:hypothetical protein